jgi:hypothetical protein
MKNSYGTPQKLYGAPQKLYGAPYANFLWKNPMKISMKFSCKEKLYYVI